MSTVTLWIYRYLLLIMRKTLPVHRSVLYCRCLVWWWLRAMLDFALYFKHTDSRVLKYSGLLTSQEVFLFVSISLLWWVGSQSEDPWSSVWCGFTGFGSLPLSGSTAPWADPHSGSLPTAANGLQERKDTMGRSAAHYCILPTTVAFTSVAQGQWWQVEGSRGLNSGEKPPGWAVPPSFAAISLARWLVDGGGR